MANWKELPVTKNNMAANSTAAPDRAELEKVLDRRDPSEAYSAL